VITPRRTRLVRVTTLAALQGFLLDVVATLDPAAASDTFVLVPTRAAGEQLRRTAEDRLLDQGVTLAWPHTGPRADLYRVLAGRAAHPLVMLPAFDREVILGRVARETAAAGLTPPFAIRPALVADMLALYDFVRRQARTVDDFARNLRLELEPAADTDRGAAALLRQTDFLAATFTAYQRYLADANLLDEHDARAALVAAPPIRPLRHVVVTVADRVADADGLWPVDFSLLATLPLLDRLDVVCTEAMLASGCLERLHAALPGLDEVSWRPDGPDEARRPVLLVPEPDGRLVYDARDRDDELAGVARRLKAGRRAGDATPLSRQALVVRRPLPYLYLARSVFGGAGIPFEALDTLPLAAEPFAAAVDLVLDIAISDASRVALVALLSSPHFHFADGEADLTPQSVSAFDRALAGARYLGGRERLSRLAEQWSIIDVPGSRVARQQQQAAPAARVAAQVVAALGPLSTDAPMAAQLAVLQGLPVAPPSPRRTRHRHRAARPRAPRRRWRARGALPRLCVPRPGRPDIRPGALVGNPPLAWRPDLRQPDG
jgi:hypothetical protein